MTRSILAATCAGMPMTARAAAEDAGPPMPGTLSAACAGKAYSPHARRRFPERPLWGDSHPHTSLSMDAGLFGNRLPQRDAHRFARGEEAVSSTGQPVRLSRPLDRLAVADRSDGMGLFGDLAAGLPQLLACEQGARGKKGLSEGGDAAVQEALDPITNFSLREMAPALMALYYARAMEIPTPRRSTYDAFRYGVDLPAGAPASTRERASASPIRYVPTSCRRPSTRNSMRGSFGGLSRWRTVAQATEGGLIEPSVVCATNTRDFSDGSRRKFLAHRDPSFATFLLC